MRGREVPPRTPLVVCDWHLSPSTSVVCEHPAALRSVRCWVVPGLVSFPPCARFSLRCGPCSSPKPQSLPGSQEAGVPPAGADSVGIPLRSTRHRLRRSDSARLRLERSAPIRAVSRSGSGRRGRLSSRIVGLFRCSREPEVSLPRHSRARRPHTARPPPPPTLHFVPRPMALPDS